MPNKSRWSAPIPTTYLPSFVFSSPNGPLSHNDNPVFVDCIRPHSHYFTFHTYREWSKRLSAGLGKAGLKPGDRALLYSGNSIFTPVVIMGVIMVGGILQRLIRHSCRVSWRTN